MAGPEAHPDRARRWVATVSAGISYILIALVASAATALVSVSPPILITAIAGLALFGALAGSVTTALEEPQHDQIDGPLQPIVGVLGALPSHSQLWGDVTGAACTESRPAPPATSSVIPASLPDQIRQWDAADVRSGKSRAAPRRSKL